VVICSGLVLAGGGSGATDNVRFCQSLRPIESYIWTENAQEPAELGQPEMVPELDSVSPAGKEPDRRAQV
jgi:hypothetical protein